jgi:hypothetical protein
LVEVSDMLIRDPAFLISMEEDLHIERNIHLISVDHLAHLVIDDLLEFVKIHDDIELLLLLAYFTLGQALLIDLDL